MEIRPAKNLHSCSSKKKRTFTVVFEPVSSLFTASSWIILLQVMYFSYYGSLQQRSAAAKETQMSLAMKKRNKHFLSSKEVSLILGTHSHPGLTKKTVVDGKEFFATRKLVELESSTLVISTCTVRSVIFCLN